MLHALCLSSWLFQFDLSSASDFLTADSLEYVSTQPAPISIQYFQQAYATPTCLPTYFAVTLSYMR